MAPKHRDGDVVASFSGKWISWMHTVVAYTAFLGALIVGLSLHYKKIVQNEHWGYPEEWFPSVSATIGDRYPERTVFQLFIAITSGPRFALVALWYLLTARPNASLPKFVLGVGLFRTFTCGGWTYITSTDDHDWHDIFMISYLIATLPWTLGCIALSPQNALAIQWRKRFATAFFSTLVPLIYFFIQHKVHRVAGAYTIYAFFEWALVLLDVAFDAVTVLDFANFEIVVKDLKGNAKGNSTTVSDTLYEKQKDKPAAQVLEPGFSVNALINAIADVYNGYVFWSILTSLGVVVWYFPLWHMGISGYEAAVMSTISPVFLGIRPLRAFCIRYVRLLHLLSLSGVAAFLVKTPELRLFAVSFAVATSCLAWTTSFFAVRSTPQHLEARLSAWSLGLLASSIAKFACHTNNPLWPIMHDENGGWNKIGLALAVLAVLRMSGGSEISDSVATAAIGKGGSSFLAGLGLSGVLFAMHSLLSDSSTMISWVWEGYPIRGPIAVPHGVLIIGAMGLGLLVGLLLPELVTSWTFYGVASIGAALLVSRANWLGYYGALTLAICTMAYAPVLVAAATKHAPGRTFFIGFFFYNIMVLFHVWVVAYAFVPGGPLVREHTDWVMVTMMLLIGCGVFSAKAVRPAIGPRNIASNEKKAKATSNSSMTKDSQWRKYYVYILLALELLATGIAYVRFNTYYDFVPYHPENKLITAGIWTIHFSLDNDMWSSERRMRDLIQELEIDVIGLLESDLQRIIMGNRDTTQFLAEDLGMYVDFGPGPNKHTWGAALLSKFPIVNSTHHLLPSPVGELAPAIHATIDAYGQLVDVFVFHSGQEEDPEDRRLQTEYLSTLMGTVTNRPAILLSYLITKPQQGNYNTYVSNISGMKDIDPSDWDRWCEYILYKGMKRTGYARVSRHTITDTELQVGKFVVGDSEGGEDERRLSNEDDVPEGLRFPQKFRGQGVRGHRYHVFNEPRYWQ